MTMIRQIARRVARAAAAARRPSYVPPGHFYSPLTSEADVDRALRTTPSMLGVDLRADGQQDLARAMAPRWRELPQGGRYDIPGNRMFPRSDAAVLSALIRMLSPKRIIEVGSGYSSAVMLDTRDPATALTFIEPYPDRLRGLLRENEVNWELIEAPVQATDPARFGDLDRDDMLFIDSTHVMKAGSDVGYLIFEILPILKSGVLVHFHDIFYAEHGLGYQPTWLREHRDWNEAYLLQAFLTHNDAYEIMFFNDFIWQTESELIREHLPETVGQRPGGLWLRRK
jgi:predicted O-methyltransferase YrrM